MSRWLRKASSMTPVSDGVASSGPRAPLAPAVNRNETVLPSGDQRGDAGTPASEVSLRSGAVARQR